MAALIGTCLFACPGAESARPAIACELTLGHIKRYTRPAAGQRILSDEVRPPDVLVSCASLIFQHLHRCTQPPDVCAAFVSDRLRAIRQDVIVQQAKSHSVLATLVSMLRYHAAIGFVLAGSAGGTWDAVQNDRRLAETISLGLEACEGVCEFPIREHLAEILAYQLVLAWPDACEVRLVITTLHRNHLLDHPIVGQTIRATRLWVARNWGGLLGELHSWSITAREFENTSSIFLRCLVQRYVPLVRAALLQTLNSAFLERQPVPLADVTHLLHFEQMSVKDAQEPAWFKCARLVVQWKLMVCERSSESDVYDAARLMALREAERTSWLSSGTDSRSLQSTPSDLVVRWSKAVLVDPCSTELYARVAISSVFDPTAVPGLPLHREWGDWLARIE